MDTIKTLFLEYLESNSKDPKEAEVSKISGLLDTAIEAGRKNEAIEKAADYELAAREAGFYAGFKAAQSILNKTEASN